MDCLSVAVEGTVFFQTPGNNPVTWHRAGEDLKPQQDHCWKSQILQGWVLPDEVIYGLHITDVIEPHFCCASLVFVQLIFCCVSVCVCVRAREIVNLINQKLEIRDCA